LDRVDLVVERAASGDASDGLLLERVDSGRVGGWRDFVLGVWQYVSMQVYMSRTCMALRDMGA
jgi:hypothetical protein